MMFSPLLQALPISEQGIPLPYIPGRDDTIALLLLCCFLLSSYILSRSRKFLLQLGKDFIMHRERASIFAISSGTDIRFLLVLILQTCILAGIYLFVCFSDLYPEIIHTTPSSFLLAGYIAIFLPPCRLHSKLHTIPLSEMVYLFYAWMDFL